MKIIVLLVLLGLGGWLYLKPKTAITDSDIQDFIARTVKSVHNRDSVGYCKHLSDDFEMRLTTLQMTDSPTKTLNKTEYCALLEEGFEVIRKSPVGYDYRFIVNSTLIAPDKKSATLTAETTERMTIKQRNIVASASSQEIELAIVKGRVVQSYARVKTRVTQ